MQQLRRSIAEAMVCDVAQQLTLLQLAVARQFRQKAWDADHRASYRTAFPQRHGVGPHDVLSFGQRSRVCKLTDQPKVRLQSLTCTDCLPALSTYHCILVVPSQHGGHEGNSIADLPFAN